MTLGMRPCCRGAASIAHYRQLSRMGSLRWDLRWFSVCSSTEILLGEWLQHTPSIHYPRAVVARRQLRGVGQRGRAWLAPAGGVWMSAALPATELSGAGRLGLAVALALSQRLERQGVPVRIKWPNDLLVHGRKLAGVLPKLVHRGEQLRLVRCGIGLNVCNQVPSGAVALQELLPHASPDVWVAEVLLALEACQDWLRGSADWLHQVEERMWAEQIADPAGGEPWGIAGLSSQGGLRLRRGAERVEWIRWP